MLKNGYKNVTFLERICAVFFCPLLVLGHFRYQEMYISKFDNFDVSLRIFLYYLWSGLWRRL